MLGGLSQLQDRFDRPQFSNTQQPMTGGRAFEGPVSTAPEVFDPATIDPTTYKFSAPAGSRQWHDNRRQLEWNGAGDAYTGDRLADLSTDLRTRSNDAAMRQRYFDSIKGTPEYQDMVNRGFDFSSGKALSDAQVNQLWSSNPDLAQGLMQELSGQNWGPQGNTEKLAKHLLRYGVTSLSDLKQQGDAVINTRTGMVIPMKSFGGSSTGEGFTQFDLKATPDGRVTPVPRWENSSDRGAIASALGVLAVPFAGPLSQYMQSIMPAGLSSALGPIGSKALTGSIMGGVTSAVGGGNPLTGAVSGAITGGLGASSGEISRMLGVDPTVGRAITSALGAGIGGALNGSNNPLQSAVLGGISAYASGTLGEYGQAQGWSPEMTKAFAGAINNLIRSRGNPMAAIQGGLNALKGT